MYVLGIKSSEAIVNINTDNLKLTKKKTQEDSVNQEINAHNHPKSGVIMILALDMLVLVVT